VRGVKLPCADQPCKYSAAIDAIERVFDWMPEEDDRMTHDPAQEIQGL
jgi:hypothetical protein